MGLQGLAEGLVVRCRADFRIEGLMTGNVIAVGAPGPSLQKRRGIAVGNAQRLQIGHEVEGIPEREPGVKLQTIGRFGQPARGGDVLSYGCQYA